MVVGCSAGYLHYMKRHVNTLMMLMAGFIVLGEAGAAAIDLPPVTIGPDTVTVTAGHPGDLAIVARPGAGRGPVIRCFWHELAFDGGGSPRSRPTTPRRGATLVLWCVYPDDRVLEGYPRLARYDPADPLPGNAVSRADAARFALQRIRFAPPEPVLSPRSRQLVGVPTWLSVASELHHDPVTAQAGPVWSSVRPLFRDATWHMGDGATVVCTTDVATTWSADADDSTCRHVYESAAPDGYRAGVTVTWTILWRNDLDPSTWRVFDTLSLTTPLAVEVASLQAAIR